MKKLLMLTTALVVLTGPAVAADMAVKAYSQPHVYSWAGFYVGGSLGYGKTTDDSLVLNPANVNGANLQSFGIVPASLDSGADGPMVGGQVGFDFQWNQIVAGLRAGLDWTNIHNRSTTPGTLVNIGVSQDIGWTATILARLGVTITPSVLVYGIGGLAAADTTATVTPSGTLCMFPGITCTSGSASSTQWGYAYGIGVEYAINQAWRAGIEYLHYDLDDQTVAINGGTPGFNAAFTTVVPTKLDTIKMSVNYRF